VKKALWITLGVRGNAGDALIYETTRKLFANTIDLDFRTVGEQTYIRPNEPLAENIILGPGGILVRTNSARHVQQKLKQQWAQVDQSRLFIWSSGILQEPFDSELPIVRRVLDKASRIVVRASKESELIQSIAPGTAPVLQPCASLFTDKLLAIEPKRRDVVVVNLDANLFTAENIENHPLKRFKEYAESEGLEVRSMVNAYGDSNRYLLDLFPLIEADQGVFGDLLAQNPSSKQFNKPFSEALQRVPSFGERYTNVRFAFGKRLHGWLPFLAFDAPAAFIGMPARRRMPHDYFGTRDFLCAVPRRRGMTIEHLDVMADMMIAKLGFFAKYEDILRRRIVNRRTQLWDELQAEALEFAAMLK
jgi:hypothetical protein